MKVVLLPLDERPCNYIYPHILPLEENIDLVLPPKNILSNKKEACDLDKLAEWVYKESINASYLIVSMDTLLFGGIVPSRIHYFSEETLFERSKILEKIKEKNPNIKIFANELIMRCPCYSLSDEEPDYYSVCGFEIFRLGVLLDKESQRELTLEEIKEKEDILAKINLKYLDDFTSRREKNIHALLHNIELVKKGIIDFFIIPQDDSTKYGFPSHDQRIIKKFILDNELISKIYLYPGADEVGMALLSRVINDYHKYKPRIYVYYGSDIGKNAIPSFEDRPIDVTISYHISAISAYRVSSISEADIVLVVNCGSEFIAKWDKKVPIVYGKNRCLSSLEQTLEYCLDINKIVGIADVSFCNEADKELMYVLKNSDMFFKIHGYAGWNTSSNTLGTVISSLVSYFYSKDDKKKDKFLLLRYVEDFIYMGIVRDYAIKIIEDKKIEGINRFNLGEYKEELEQETIKLMLNEIQNFSNVLYNKIKSLDVEFSWNRTFEIELNIEEK